VLSGAVFCANAFAQSPAPENWDARLSKCSGRVRVFAAGHEPGVKGTAGMPLEEGDRVTTGVDSSAEVAWDSGRSVLRLSAGSIFTLQGTSRSDTVFGLKLGGFLAKIKTLVQGQNLRFETPAAVASVRGTELGVAVPKDSGEIHVGVFDEGKVEVMGKSGEVALVGPNQETVVSRDGKPAAPGELKHFSAQGRAMRALIRRASELQKSWTALAPEERRKLRQADIRAGSADSSGPRSHDAHQGHEHSGKR
jgi:hypothetical protein